MKYYKVLHYHNNELFSGGLPLVSNYSYCYLEEGINYPKIGKFFVFNTLENAINFARPYPNRVIFTCEVTNPQPTNRISHTYDSFISSFWHHTYSIFEIKNAPMGTILVDSIKLIEQVWESPLKEKNYDNI